MSIHSKNKGNRFELETIKLLKDLGYKAVSSRSESRSLDDKGVDIVTDAPFGIQCMHVEKMSMPIHELIKKMRINDIDNPVVMHKRNNKGVIVSMDLALFETLLFYFDRKL